MTTRADLIAEARSWIGTPWVHQQRLKGVGADCVGFAGGVLIALGIYAADHPDALPFAGYGREPDGRRLQAACDVFLHRIEWAEVQPADFLLCSFRGGRPRHMGIVTDDNPDRMYWIHCNDNPKHGRVHESRLMFAEQRMKLIQAYRVPGLI